MVKTQSRLFSGLFFSFWFIILVVTANINTYAINWYKLKIRKQQWQPLLCCMIIPIALGILFNKYLLRRASWLEKLMPLVSMFGIAFIIVIITAAGRDSLLNIGGLLVILVLVHNLLGYTFGYWAGRLFKMTERDCRTMAIEVGMQNAGLASGLAKAMGKITTIGLAPAVFSPIMNTTGLLLANY